MCIRQCIASRCDWLKLPFVYLVVLQIGGPSWLVPVLLAGPGPPPCSARFAGWRPSGRSWGETRAPPSSRAAGPALIGRSCAPTLDGHCSHVRISPRELGKIQRNIG